MCAYNGLPYIKDAVADILAQTYTNWELVIADDGSNDGTREWLNEHCTDARIRLIFNEKNLGYVGNKNLVHQQATGDYITQLDNDDRCAHDRLEKLVNVVLQKPDIKIVASGFQRIDSNGAVYGQLVPETDIILTEKPDNGYPFWFPALMVHRSVFDTMGYFDPYFSGALGDDIYWTVRANTNYPIYCLKDALYAYRNNPNSITNDYSSLRKLIMPEVLRYLFIQRKNTGTDFLEQRDMEALNKLEEKFKADKKFMAEQYRIWAAKAVDKSDFILAKKLLKQAFECNMYSKTLINTTFYWFRKQVTAFLSGNN